MKIKNSVVLVTGSAVRVGKSIATVLAQKGARVVIHYRTRRDEAEETARELETFSGHPLIVQGDISRRSDWTRMRQEILDYYGRIDVLVNSAAIFYKTPFFKISDEQWDEFLDVNLRGVFLGCQIMGEVMKQQKRGKIINIADVAAEKVWSEYIPYCVSKAGVVALTRGLAKALAPEVMVNCIAPGTVLLADEYDEEEEQRLIEKTPLKR
ncbi:MAG: SDR family NAD(P)-dependent oxidoreductase, partial [Calditrichaeota bacterium]